MIKGKKKNLIETTPGNKAVEIPPQPPTAAIMRD